MRPSSAGSSGGKSQLAAPSPLPLLSRALELLTGSAAGAAAASAAAAAAAGSSGGAGHAAGDSSGTALPVQQPPAEEGLTEALRPVRLHFEPAGSRTGPALPLEERPVAQPCCNDPQLQHHTAQAGSGVESAAAAGLTTAAAGGWEAEQRPSTACTRTQALQRLKQRRLLQLQQEGGTAGGVSSPSLRQSLEGGLSGSTASGAAPADDSTASRSLVQQQQQQRQPPLDPQQNAPPPLQQRSPQRGGEAPPDGQQPQPGEQAEEEALRGARPFLRRKSQMIPMQASLFPLLLLVLGGLFGMSTDTLCPVWYAAVRAACHALLVALLSYRLLSKSVLQTPACFASYCCRSCLIGTLCGHAPARAGRTAPAAAAGPARLVSGAALRHATCSWWAFGEQHACCCWHEGRPCELTGRMHTPDSCTFRAGGSPGSTAAGSRASTPRVPATAPPVQLRPGSSRLASSSRLGTAGCGGGNEGMVSSSLEPPGVAMYTLKPMLTRTGSRGGAAAQAASRAVQTVPPRPQRPRMPQAGHGHERAPTPPASRLAGGKPAPARARTTPFAPRPNSGDGGWGGRSAHTQRPRGTPLYDASSLLPLSVADLMGPIGGLSGSGFDSSGGYGGDSAVQELHARHHGGARPGSSSRPGSSGVRGTGGGSSRPGSSARNAGPGGSRPGSSGGAGDVASDDDMGPLHDLLSQVDRMLRQVERAAH